MAEGIAEIYRRSKKPRDLWWNEWVARPPAAVLVYLLKGTPLTPNQVTFLSLLVALIGYGVFVGWRSYWGGVAGALLVELAFILDCTDGQLARIKGKTSAVGGYLDFLMDEVKAVALVAALSGRQAWHEVDLGRGDLLSGEAGWLGPQGWLVVGLAGVVVVSTGISLTTFMRRPEYAGAGVGAPDEFGDIRPMSAGPRPEKPRTVVGRVVAACEWAGRSVLHYPAWIWVPAVVGRMEWFLVPYLAAHALYLGRAGLAVLWRLGRF